MAVTGEWMDKGACLDSDPELFFPVGTTGPSALQIEEAKAICKTCPVIDTCLKYSLEVGEFGIWGGLTEDERRALKRRGKYAIRRLGRRALGA